MSEFGLYIHIPFCVSKCIYCDFLSKTCSASVIDRYFNVLYNEIELQGKKIESTITTIYIGGGTPSLVDIKYIDKLFYTIKNNFKCNLSEVSIECNPESLTEEKLICYKNNGVNRISIGVQTLNDDLLKIIGRAHNSEQAIKAISLAKKYFENVSADVMLGLPNQTIADAKNTIEKLIDLQLTHISAYGLKVEDGTKLQTLIENKTLEINEDLSVDMYDSIVKILSKNGFMRYEVSNFAKNKYECKHNLAYWQRTDYLGVGAGAFSFIDNLRWNNIQSIEGYIENLENGLNIIENISKIEGIDARFEEIMLALRTSYGLNISNFNSKFDADFLNDYTEVIKKNKNNLVIKNGTISINKDSYYILNSILVDFL